MILLSIRNFMIEQIEQGGYAVLRYDSEAQEFDYFGERADLREAILLMLDGVRAEVASDEKFGLVTMPEPLIFAKKKMLKGKITLSVRPVVER